MTKELFADIILPLAVRGRFTYLIPSHLSQKIKPGVRVIVQFGGKNLYQGIVHSVHGNSPAGRKIKTVLEVADEIPVVNELQLKLWSWISEYYMCSEGEVMKAAVPSGAGSPDFRPKTETYIKLSRDFSDTELNSILDSLVRAPRQKELLSAYLHIISAGSDRKAEPVERSFLLSQSHCSQPVLDSLISKGILSVYARSVSRLAGDDGRKEVLKTLSDAQVNAFSSVRSQLIEKDIVLLHGVTSSGKTEIYIHLIEEQLKAGKQVLYMLPEIALTTQIIQRLRRHFGDVTGIYHSRFSDNEKTEIWNKVREPDPSQGYRLILGVRSSLFLPFSDLGLIIIDEEHDTSYKQHDPAPRYHARDTAIILASLHKAKTILGSASPSVESYNNAVTGKYGFAELKERYGFIKLPEIIVANTREAFRKKRMVSHFTPELLFAIDEALGNGEQIILFQNRRGFSPYIECSECGWIPTCIQCAVSLTYHKAIGRLVCHYCGYSAAIPSSCQSCGNQGMVTRGFGTEKIEDEIKIVFPKVRVARMDQDTTRGKNAFSKIIKAFEERQTDILIGTQMISKGLDFENLTVVGILNADSLLNYPDFRAHERSFQLMEQVSGRAGRRQKQGKVIIQTADPANRIIRLVLRHDYHNMFLMQTEERKTFNYPPFCRMIRINIRHRDKSLLNMYAGLLGNDLRELFGKRVLGPEFPVISQIQSWHIKTILLKIEKDKSLTGTKKLILESIQRVENEKGASGLRISADVDPY